VTATARVRAPELRGRGWLNTGGRALSLADLRGKVVLLDFWTFCCINCLHVLDELRPLEERYADVLVTVGVHSPKFEHEADPAALAAAVERYEVHHPVLDDPDLVTWAAYTARAWPTLVVVDPEGYVVAQVSGEGHAHALDRLVAGLVAEHEAKGTLHRGDGPYVPPAPPDTDLRFPGKAVRLPGGTLLVSDSGHHSLVELAEDAETVLRRIGTGTRGRTDGHPATASFAEPQGLCLLPPEVAAEAGYDVVVADTANHLLRGVRLVDGAVTTVAGTGAQLMQGDPQPAAGDSRTPLSSPWDVVWSPVVHQVVVAMAGVHQLWAFDPVTRAMTVWAGTSNEGLLDGPLADAWFAQTSGLAVDGERIWLADSETSSLRAVEQGAVSTAVGQGLFDFGHVDGPGETALLQHPLGVTLLPDGSVAVSDTYNGAVRRYDPSTGEVTTLLAGLAEPSAALVAGEHLIVVESAAHRLTRLRLPAAALVVDGTARRTSRPVTEVGPGDVDLEVVFTPPPGQKLDERYGPATRLLVSATPPGLLKEGDGTGTDLVRRITLNGQVGDGVLHVAARAASCDEPGEGVDFPACHVHQQDWGVPLRVVDGAPSSLTLHLAG